MAQVATSNMYDGTNQNSMSVNPSNSANSRRPNPHSSNKPTYPNSASSPQGYVDIISSKKINLGNIIALDKDKGAKQYQEDSICIFVSPDLTFLASCVYDGHGGLNGQVASRTCTELAKEYFEKVKRTVPQRTALPFPFPFALLTDDVHRNVAGEWLLFESLHSTPARYSLCLVRGVPQTPSHLSRRIGNGAGHGRMKNGRRV